MRLINYIFFIIFSVNAATCYALASDAKSRLNIVADTYFKNYKTGIEIFTGHVVADQGTTHLRADKLITKSNPTHDIIEATAYGYSTLAHYWTQPNLKDPVLHAYARIITFYPKSGDVTLQKQVHVNQGENRFAGELVFYNNNAQTIRVPPTKNGRAMIVYNPED